MDSRRFKLTLITIVILLASSAATFGQWSAGFKGGWHQNFVKANEPFGTNDNKSNWHLGIYAQLPLAKQLLFIPEVQVSFRTYDINIFFEDFKPSYVEIPMMVSYQPLTWLNLEIGPYVAFRISPSSDNSNMYPEAAFTETIEWGATTGLRFNVTSSFSIVPRYSMAFVPVADASLRDEANQPLGDITLFNRTFEISLAWKTSFGKQ